MLLMNSTEIMMFLRRQLPLTRELALAKNLKRSLDASHNQTQTCLSQLAIVVVSRHQSATDLIYRAYI